MRGVSVSEFSLVVPKSPRVRGHKLFALPRALTKAMGCGIIYLECSPNALSQHPNTDLDFSGNHFYLVVKVH